MISVKVYVRDTEVLLAACDEELIGTTLRSGDIRLTVSRSFYHSNIVSEEEFEDMMCEATSMNLVGNRTVGLAKKVGRVAPDAVMVIGDVEHAQAVRM